MQTASKQVRAHCRETACAARNSSVREQPTKADVHTNCTTHKQGNTVKKAPASVSSQGQPLLRSSMNSRTTIKTDLQKRILVTGLEKVAHKSQVKCPTTKQRLTNTNLSCADTKSLINKQGVVTLKATKEGNNFNKTHTDLKKPLNRCPLAKPERSGKTQTGAQVKQLSNKIGNKPEPTHTQRGVPVTAKQRSSLLPTFSKTENASKSTATPVAGVKTAAPHHQQRRTTFKVPSKPTVQAPGPQTLPRPTKTSSLIRGPKTPKSAFNPGTNGVRTVPLDARTELTTAQEQRM